MLRSLQILALIASVFSSADPLAAGTDQAYRLLIQENHEQAITAYEGYLEEHPDDYEALFNLGTAFYRTSRFSSAAECFEKSIPLAI
ncbi:MAG TPA: tetratricopeptide repeat protein, partial [Opitutales bacterium]|nr:tetratricopeptide repeat protein [Opitutales bacterium]